MLTIRKVPWGTLAALIALAVIPGAPAPAPAGTLYATSITTDRIFAVDTVTHSITPVFNAGLNLDSLVFDPSGRIIYTELNNGTVAAFNPNTNSNVNLATGLNQPIDLALEPSLTSVLISEANTNTLRRVSLAGGSLATLTLSPSRRPDGLIYDSSGRLFVNASTSFATNNSVVWRLDPTTGAVLATSGNTGVFLDGLTFDSFTGKLFASDYNNGRIVQIDPNNLSSFSFLTPLGAALSQPDGIVSDGLGNLFLASRGNSSVIQYNIATNTDTVLGTIAGLDDLAPLSGLGAPVVSAAVPEPSTLLLFGVGAVALLGRRLRGRRGRTSA